MTIKVDEKTLENFEKELAKKGDETFWTPETVENKQLKLSSEAYGAAKCLFRDWDFDIEIAYLCAYHFFNAEAPVTDDVNAEEIAKVKKCRKVVELDRFQVSDLLLAYSEKVKYV